MSAEEKHAALRKELGPINPKLAARSEAAEQGWVKEFTRIAQNPVWKKAHENAAKDGCEAGRAKGDVKKPDG